MKRMLNSRGLLVALSMAAAMLSSFAFSQTKQRGNMAGESKVLVAYFSATGTTAGIAKAIADGCGGTLCEIKPVKPYTDTDLNWYDKKSRITIECDDKSFRCPMQPLDANIADYDTIIVGFPIWRRTAPSII